MNQKRVLSRIVSRMPLAVSVAMLAACGSDGNGAGWYGNGLGGAESTNHTYVPHPGCDYQFFGQCDYADESCQTQVFGAVRCMLGASDAEMPPVTAITEEELADELAAELAADDSESDLDASYARAVVLIGLADEGGLDDDTSVEAYVDAVAAYYSPDSGVVTIVIHDDATADDDYLNTLSLAHEFVHAVQDQQFNLQAIQEEREVTFDGYLATRAGIEGEAVLFQLFYDLALNGYLPSEIDFDKFFAEWFDDTDMLGDGYSPLITAPQIFPYLHGSRYVYNIYAAQGEDAIRDLPSYIPTTSLEVMLSYDSVARLDLPQPYRSAVAPPQGYSYIAEDVLGAWILGNLVELRDLDEVSTADIENWNRDHLAIYSDGRGQTAVLWRLELADSGSAAALSAAFSNASFYPEDAGHTVRVSNNTVNLLVTDDATSIDDWTAAIESGDIVTSGDYASENANGSSAPARPHRIVNQLRKRMLLHGRLAPNPGAPGPLRPILTLPSIPFR